jgi:cation transport ATPase
MQIDGYAVALAAIFGGLALAAWAYKRFHRITAWLVALSAFLLAAGVTAWTDALASLIRSGTGITVLIAVLLISALAFYFEAVVKHKHHRIRTPFIGAVFGTAVLLALASLGRLLSEAAKSPANAGRAISTSLAHIRSGQAAAAATGSHGTPVLLTALGIVVALVMVAMRVERRGPGRGRGGPSGPPAIEAGRPRALPRGGH